MGEKSKTIGELGENIYSGIVQIFGWAEAENISISCNKKSVHDKITHGIDSLIVQKNPLIADEAEVGIVSVKNVKSGKIKSNFKKFADDLIETAICLRRDTVFSDYTSNIEARIINDKQLLFWFTNDKDDNYSVIKEVGNTWPSTSEKFSQLVLVDNRTVSFHYDLRKFVDNTFKEAISIDYYYPDTGLNESLSEARLLNGKQLPIGWVTSPIIPYKVSLKGEKNTLVLGLNESCDEDCFRRLAGLSQNLTGGWCNKVFLCFPDYRYQDHKVIKDKVLLQFADQHFANMVEVWSFNPNFQSLEESNKIYFKNVETKETEKQDFNIERMLPFGDTLRQLLNQLYINKADIVKILNRRRVFVDNSLKKIELIPILSTSFISPSELEYLRRCQSSRANSERISSSTIVTSNEEAVKEVVLSSQIPIENIAKSVSPNISVGSISKLAVHGDGSIRLKIPTKSHHISKDWAQSNTNNITEIIINKGITHGNNIKARIDVIASSPENKKIGQEIVKHIESEIRKNGALRRDFTLEKTLAIEFSNRKRAELLFTFFLDNINFVSSICFKDLKNIDFVIANSMEKKLNDDLLTLKDKVERSIFSGRNLQDIKYINDKEYYDFLIFTEVIADFVFEYNGIKGVFEVQYGFPDFDPAVIEDKSEFEFKITRVTPFIERNLSKKENHDIEAHLREEFAKMKQEAINITDKKYGRQTKMFD